uniref:Uncharacterized protein n=1 Tax=Oncorhynchus kisutch TaxID=8019 RepID=A0A8C7KKQ1_ONCKI
MWLLILFPLHPRNGSDGQAEPILILQDLSNYNRWFSGQPRSLMDRPAEHPHIVVPRLQEDVLHGQPLLDVSCVSVGHLST